MLLCVIRLLNHSLPPQRIITVKLLRKKYCVNYLKVVDTNTKNHGEIHLCRY